MTTVDPLDLLEGLLSIDSVNTTMGGPGERRMAEALARVLEGIGCQVSLLPGAGSEARPNLIAILPGRTGLPVVLLEAHLDTVAQPRDGIAVRREGERVFGRGACDTKGSAAAMVAAMARIAEVPDRPTVVFAGTADEEVAMAGARTLIDQLPHVDAAIVGEPTSLLPMRVHNGLIRFRIVARGRAAHTSRAHLGVNAVAAAARAALAIQDDLVPRLQARAHPLAGPALATAAMIHGGVAPNLVPEWAEIEVDRRIAPGEDPAAALAEIDALLDPLRVRGDDLVREDPTIEQPPVQTPADHPLVRLTESVVTRELGRAVVAGGVPYGTDASCLSGVGGIPCVVLGPGSIDQAHTEDEWVAAYEVVASARIYEAIVLRSAELTLGHMPS
jgi:acetylornithine deacetylase/succinyl-diaminopimelate desuccinylase-like protein